MIAGRLKGIPEKLFQSLKSPAILVPASAAPILAFRHPPIMDAPNHLARIWLETQVPLAGLLEKAYIIDWSRASSNILVDRVGAPLMRLMGFDTFWVLVTLLMVLGAPLAAIFISREINGRANPWQCLALSTAWGQSTILGFISFSLSMALALTLCLLNLKLARRLGGKALCAIKSLEILAIYLTHPFGVGLFLAFEFAMLLGDEMAGIMKLTRQRILDALLQQALMVAPTVMYIAWNRGSSPLQINPVDYRGLISHLVSLISPFFAYDAAIELCLLAVIIFCVLAAVLQGRLAFHAGLFVSVVILGVLALLIPDGVGNASLLTRRLPLMAALLLCISVRARENVAGVGREPLVPLCGLMILAHSALIFVIWAERERDYVSVVEASSRISPGSRVLIAIVQQPPSSTQAPGTYVHGFFTRSHLPALLIPLSRSYVPVLFAIPGQQPLRFTNRFQKLQAQIANIPTDRDVVRRTPPYRSDRYLESWDCDFDYIMMLKPQARATYAPLMQTRLVMTSDFADLLLIDRPAFCTRPR